MRKLLFPSVLPSYHNRRRWPRVTICRRGWLLLVLRVRCSLWRVAQSGCSMVDCRITLPPRRASSFPRTRFRADIPVFMLLVHLVGSVLLCRIALTVRVVHLKLVFSSRARPATAGRNRCTTFPIMRMVPFITNVIHCYQGGILLTPKTSNQSLIPLHAENRVITCVRMLFGYRSSIFFIFSILFWMHFLGFILLFCIYNYKLFVIGVAAGSCSYHQSSIAVSKHMYI